MNFNEEQIEAYVRGKLSGEEKFHFEEGMKIDSSIQNEVELQQDILESLKSVRKAQLKQRLNNIAVSSGTASTGVSTTLKIAASVLTIGMVGAGLYYMTVVRPSKSAEEQSVKVVVNNEIPSTSPANVNDTLEPLNSNSGTTSSTTQDASGTNTVRNNNKLVGKDLNNQVTTQNKSTRIIEANVPNAVVVDADMDRLDRDRTIEVPDGSIGGQANIVKAENVEVSISDKNKKDFSYQYYSNKLFLYGDFNEKPYELLEINNNKGQRLYLFFEGSYYELKSNQTKVARLKEVKDPSLLKSLNK